MLEKSLEIGGYLKGSSRGRVGHDFGHEGRKESLQLVIEPDKKKASSSRRLCYIMTGRVKPVTGMSE